MPSDHSLQAAAPALDADLEWLAACLQARLTGYFGQPPVSPGLPGAAAAPPRCAGLPLPRRGGAPWPRRHRPPGGGTGAGAAAAPAVAGTCCGLAIRPPSARTPSSPAWARAPVLCPPSRPPAFCSAGDALGLRLAALRRLAPDARLVRADVLRVAAAPGERVAGPFAEALGGVLTLSPQFLAEALPGLSLPAAADAGLQARRVVSGLGWADLVLPAQTLAQLDDIGLWLTHGATLISGWGLGRRIAPGYVSLFHGPSGTGKTLSACLLGQRCGREVLRVDLSQIRIQVHRRNREELARLFKAAEGSGRILFFDEADALFGKRTGVSDAHDRYANQEVSYLLQRHRGLRRRRDPGHQPAPQHRRRLPAPLPVGGELPDAARRRAAAAVA